MTSRPSSHGAPVDALPPLVPEFRPEGRTPGWKNTFQRILDRSILGRAIHPGCRRKEGRVARLEVRSVNPLWRIARDHALRDGDPIGRLAVDPRLAKAIHVVWLDDGDSPVGYTVPAVLHATQAGDRVRLWVRPDDGRIVDLRNLDRPRRWL